MYGICLPLTGFSALFVVVSLSAVVSALIAGAMVHRLQAQRELARDNARKLGNLVPASLQSAAAAMATARVTSTTDGRATATGWLQAYGVFRARCAAQQLDTRRHVDSN